MASGYLELQGFSTALAAMDAMCKAAHVRVAAVDANNPANPQAAHIPVMVQVKLTGGVADIQAALDAGRYTAEKYLPGDVILDHTISSNEQPLQDLLKGGKLPPRRASGRKKRPDAIGVFDIQGFSNAVVVLDILLKNAAVQLLDAHKYLGGQVVTLIVGGTVAAVQASKEEATTHFGNRPFFKSGLVILNPHGELFRFIQ